MILQPTRAWERDNTLDSHVENVAVPETVDRGVQSHCFREGMAMMEPGKVPKPCQGEQEQEQEQGPLFRFLGESQCAEMGEGLARKNQDRE